MVTVNNSDYYNNIPAGRDLNNLPNTSSAGTTVGYQYDGLTEEDRFVQKVLQEHYDKVYKENLSHSDPMTYIESKYCDVTSPNFCSYMTEDQRSIAYRNEKRMLQTGGKYSAGFARYDYALRNYKDVYTGGSRSVGYVRKGLINYSDVVFIEEPTYNGAIQVFKSRGAKVVSIPMLDDGIDIGILKLKLEKIKPRLMYIMPNFQNPTGISYSTYKKKKLIELAQEYDFYILEDDFISDFKFESKDNRPLRSYDDKNRVIYIKSFSKIFMPGLRMGIVEIPNELLEVVLRAKHSSDISTPGLIQKSMYYYLENFSLEKYLKSVEEVYTKKYLFAKELISNKLCNKLKMKSLDGGMNFFLELPRGYSSHEFARYMLNKGVAVLPGTYFFDNLIDDRFFRINIANPSIQEIEKGISIISDNIDDFLEKYKYKLNDKSNILFY